jgi:multidrug efflux pump subunit AcrA (membrane-fusion protein)
MKRTLLAGAAIGVAATLLAACGGADDTQPPVTAAPLAVRTTTVSQVRAQAWFDAGGVVAADESATIASRIVAPVRAVHVRAGDAVRAGDVLVTLDARDLSAQAREAGAASESAEHALAQARSEEVSAAADQRLALAWRTRMATLHERGSATAQEFDEAEARLASANARQTGAQAAVEQAIARVASLRAGAEAAAITQSFTTIRAPFAGIVTERLTDPGNLASPGVPLLRLDAAGPRRVEVSVDESRAAQVHPGDPVQVLIEGAAPIDGRVSEVARTVTPDQRAFVVKVSLPREASPRTGTFARVRFRGATEPALVIPSESLRRQGQVTSVFVVQDGVARLRLVQVGETGDEGTHVQAGLDAGEVVVVDPPAVLLDGRRVTSAAPRAPVRGKA